MAGVLKRHPLPLRGLVVSLLACAGCATDRGGAQGLDDVLDGIVAGTSSEAELREQLGGPDFLRVDATGQRYLTYQTYSIPLYGLIDDSEVVVFLVRDGTVQSWQTGSYF